jgi:hypothetical protein
MPVQPAWFLALISENGLSTANVNSEELAGGGLLLIFVLLLMIIKLGNPGSDAGLAKFDSSDNRLALGAGVCLLPPHPAPLPLN